MINIIIDIFLMIILIIIANSNFRNGLVFYCILNFCAPVFPILGNRLGFDIVCFPILLMLFFLKQGTIFTIKANNHSLLPFLIVYCLISVGTSFVFHGGISIVSIYSIIRFVLTIYFIQVVNKGNSYLFFIDDVIKIILPIECVCCLIQVLNILPVRLFYELYYKESLVPLQQSLQLGSFTRAFGTSGTPLSISGAVVLAFVVYFIDYFEQERCLKKHMFKMIMCIFCAILCLSKTAMLGIPLVVVLSMIVLPKNAANLRVMFRMLCLLLLLLFAGNAIIAFMESKGTAIWYYLSYFKNPLSALDTRYSSQGGNLKYTLDVIQEHFIFGVGGLNIDGVFKGDSAYIVILYETGLVGLIAYFFPYVTSWMFAIRHKDYIKIVLIIMFMVICIANTYHLASYIAPFVAFMLDNHCIEEYDREMKYI